MKTSGRRTVFPYVRLLGCVLAGALCMLAFTLSPAGYVGISDPPLAAGSAVWLLYAALLAGLCWLATGRRAARLTPAMAVFALLFGVINYFATTLFAYDTWAFLRGAGAWAQAGSRIALQSTVMAAVFAVVGGWLEGVQGKHGNAQQTKPWQTIQDIQGTQALQDTQVLPDAQTAYATQDTQAAQSTQATQDTHGIQMERAVQGTQSAQTDAQQPKPWQTIQDIQCTQALQETQDIKTIVTQPVPVQGKQDTQGTQAAQDTQALPDTQPTNAAPASGGGQATGAASIAARLARVLHAVPDTLLRRYPLAVGWARRHPIPACMLVMLVGWSPFLIAFYPGTIIWDMGEMIGQFYGLREMSTWHPVFTTWLFGALVWLGRLVNGDNLGAFLFMALQTTALAYALADSLRLMARMGVARRWRFAALLLFAFTPIFAAFAQAVGKDTLYTAALLLFATRLTEALRFGGLTGRRLAGLFVWALLACLVRANGLYVVMGTAAGATLFGLRGLQRVKIGGVMGAAVAVALLFTGVLIPALGIKDTSASGLYSLAFQQSARVLRDHGASVTAQEYAEIDLVLDAARLPDLYEANISDPVKYTFRQYGQGHAAEASALARYRRTWLSMLGQYPLTYLEAFVAGSTGYYAFTPKIDAARTYNYQGGIRFVFETYDVGEDARYLHTQQSPALETARRLLAAYARGWRRLPVLELFLFCPSYTWLLVAAALTLLRRRGVREGMAFLPALLSMGVCLLSPVNDYFRYFLPIVAMTPMLMGLAGTGAITKKKAQRALFTR